MSHSHVIRLLLLLSIVLWPTFVRAQQTSTSRNTEEAALRQKAFNLLEPLAAQISGLQSTANRARIGSNIVGSLWSHDEKRARSLLALVAEDIRVRLREVPDDPQNAHTIMVFLRLREDTAERVAKYDPEDALAFLKATEVKLEKSPRGVEEREQEFLVGLAHNVGAKDRNRALQLLNQAQGIAETMPDGSDKMKVMIGLAMFFCFEKSDRGFAMMESVVPTLNALIDVYPSYFAFSHH